MKEKIKIKRTSKRLIHVIAHCQDCNWQEEDYISAAREATKHCRKTGHTISVEQGNYYQVLKET